MTAPGMIGSETVLVDAWIVDTLNNSPAVQALVPDGVPAFAHRAPVGTPFPYVIVTRAGAVDIRVVGGGLPLWIDGRWIVRVIGGTADAGPLAPISTACLVALASPAGAGVAGHVPGGTVLSCVRVGPFDAIEIEDGQEYRHLGHELRVQAQAVGPV